MDLFDWGAPGCTYAAETYAHCRACRIAFVVVGANVVPVVAQVEDDGLRGEGDFTWFRWGLVAGEIGEGRE